MNSVAPTTSGGASGSNSTGSYGGLGYESDSSNALYGDFRNPNEVGSGGDDYRGGGLVRLIATNLILDGSINANGSGSSGTGNYGAGSGGGIYIDVQNLSSSAGENASITANGGQAYQAGGGGRIAIYYENLNNFNFDGVIAAGGNGHGTRDGQPGSVHIPDQGSLTYITGHHPIGSVNQLQTFGVTFGNEIDELSFTPADISITGPNGAVPVIGITRLRGTTFVFETGTLQEGEYTVTLGPDIESRGGLTMDTNADGASDANDTYTFTFNLDNTTPAKPVVTSHSTLELETQQELSATIAGTREEDVRIFINGTEMLASGTLDWSLDLDLTEGLNTFVITAVDEAGNISQIHKVRIDVDSIAPALDSITPQGNSHVSEISEIILDVTEQRSGVDTVNSQFSLLRWRYSYFVAITIDQNTVTLSSAGNLLDGSYELSGTLFDLYGNSQVISGNFIVDSVAPEKLVVLIQVISNYKRQP